MTEGEQGAADLCRALLENGYVIVRRNGFPKFIEQTGNALVLRLLADRAVPEAWEPSEMLRAAPEKGSHAGLLGVGCKP